MNVNMAGFYHITQLALAEMVKQESGHVVTVTGSFDNGVSGSHTADEGRPERYYQSAGN
jgi:NADP-dependent 3-hydroxy acid dehydrogenase YdfG